MSNLFSAAAADRRIQSAPLANRLRPRNLDEMVGQQHLVGPGAVLRLLIERDRIGSVLLWGPPGTGKTTLARLVAGHSKAHFEQLSATTAGVKDFKDIAAAAESRFEQFEMNTLVFIDEVHRLSKTQMDVLLPYIEAAIFTFMGATTENPYFSLNAALLSRCVLFRLDPIDDASIKEMLHRGLKCLEAEADPEALEQIITWAGGDARHALGLLDMAWNVASSRPDTPVEVREGDLEAAGAIRIHHNDRGDHYELSRVWIASMFSSDADAAVYWLARCVRAGIDPRYLARRMVILASEEIGLAQPSALNTAIAGFQALELVGMPEAGLNLAQVTIQLALAPKSLTSARAWWRANELVNTHPDYPIPSALHITAQPGASGSQAGYSEVFNQHLHSDTPIDCMPVELAGERLVVGKVDTQPIHKRPGEAFDLW